MPQSPETAPKWDGLPRNPERDGWHWLAGPDPNSEPIPNYWSAAPQGWAVGNFLLLPKHLVDAGLHYLGPCVPPLTLPKRR